jgi:hypothetical protein
MDAQTVDLALVVVANLVNLLVAGMFLCRAFGRARCATVVGLASLALSLPIAGVVAFNIIEARERWTFILPALWILYSVVEFVLDYVLKLNFRETALLWPYLILYYLAQLGLVGYGYGVGDLYGFITLGTYFVCLGAMAFSYAASVTAREVDEGRARMRQHYRAPWSTKLKITTGVFLVICVVAAYLAKQWAPLVILGIVLAAAFLAVRGYSVLDGKVMIHHLGWATKYDLADLTSVEVSPGATMGSIRTFGIGGLFSFAGYFRNEVLGLYRSFATDDMNTVVLDFSGKKVVVTPEDPHGFAEAVGVERGGVGN